MVDAPQVPVIKGVQPEAKEAPQVPQQSSLDHRSSPNPTSPLKPTPPTKPKKRLKLILIILIALVGLSIGGFFVWKYFFASKTSVPLLERIVKQKKEEEVYIYKGVWLPALVFREPNFLASNIQKLKGMGINTIFIEASPPQSERWLEKVKEFFPPELVERIAEILPSEKELIIDNIQIAHRNGLKVGLTISDLGLTISDPPEMGEVDLEVLNSEIVEYAKLAEEYEVELFAPMNEPGKVFGENTGKWRQEILPKIKKVYNGEVIWKGAGIGLPEKELTEEFLKELSEGPPGDLSGYDYRGFSSMFIPSDNMEPEELLQYADMLTLEDYSTYVDNTIKYTLALAEKDGCKGIMISEFGVLDEESLSEEEIARAYEIVLERGKDEVVGFFAFSDSLLGLDLPGMVVEENPKAQEVIREWFTEILPEKKWISY